jgi:hypothetical protein
MGGLPYIASINQMFYIGDAVTVTYRPKVQLLKPLQSTIKTGVLVDIV